VRDETLLVGWVLVMGIRHVKMDTTPFGNHAIAASVVQMTASGGAHFDVLILRLPGQPPRRYNVLVTAAPDPPPEGSAPTV